MKKKLENCFKKEGYNAIETEKREEQEPNKKSKTKNRKQENFIFQEITPTEKAD